MFWIIKLKRASNISVSICWVALQKLKIWIQFLQNSDFFLVFSSTNTYRPATSRGHRMHYDPYVKYVLKKDLVNFNMFYWYAFVIICFHIVKSSELRGSSDQPTCPVQTAWGSKIAKAAPDPSPHICVPSVAIPGMYIGATIELIFFQEYEVLTAALWILLNKNVIKINFLTFYKL